MLGTATAFIKRDFLQAISYKASFSFRLLAIVFWASMMYFMSSVFEGTASSALKAYGGNYFAFLLIGVALLDYHTLSLQIFSNSIRESQMMGTLEIMLLSPTRLSAILVYSSLWGYIFTSFRFMLYLLTGMILFGMDLGGANVLGGGVVLFLSIICFAGLGIITAAVIMVFKEAGSISMFVGAVSLMLGGVAYPVEVLPSWLTKVSFLIPLTHSLKGMRQALLKGYSFIELFPEACALVIFSAIFFPLGLLAFHVAVQRVKVTGTLGHY